MQKVLNGALPGGFLVGRSPSAAGHHLSVSRPADHLPQRVSTADPTITARFDQALAPGDARRSAMIAEAAYYRAACRGFEPGHELEDWLAAEREIDVALSGAVQ